MTFTKSIKICFCKYANFRGRASRSEYWWFALFVWLVSLVVRTVDSGWSWQAGDPGWLFEFLWWLPILLPVTAVSVRRLHDIGLSGWWLTVPFLMLCIAFFIPMGKETKEDGMLAHAYYGMYGEFPTCDLVGCLLIGLFSLLPIGISIVWFATKGQAEPNKYGDPLELEPVMANRGSLSLLISIGIGIAVFLALVFLKPFFPNVNSLWIALGVIVLGKVLTNAFIKIKEQSE